MSAPRKLVIVESPAKARTIAGYLGVGYEVEASVGHIRDLPQPSELPAEMKKGPYGKFAVDDVVRLEPVLDVDRELAERALLHLRRQLGRLEEVTDVADAGLDLVAVAEVPGDRACLGRRLHDDELAGGGHEDLLP